MPENQPSVFRKVYRVLRWFVFIPLGLVALIFFLLWLPPVQSLLADKVESIAESSYGIDLEVDRVGIGLRWVKIEKAFIKDNQQDTLAYVGRLWVRPDWFKLFSKQLYIKGIELDNSYARLTRPANDSSFNFSFIAEAFAKPDTAAATPAPATPAADTAATGFALLLDELALDNVRLEYLDSLTGNFMNARVGLLTGKLNVFDLDSLHFETGPVRIADTRFTYLITKESVKDTTEEASPLPYLYFEQLEAVNTHFAFEDKTARTRFATNIGTLRGDESSINLNKQQVDFEAFFLEQSDVLVQMHSPLEAEGTAEADTTEKGFMGGWAISSDKLGLGDAEFQLYNTAIAPLPENKVDFNHLHLQRLFVNASNLQLSDSVIQLQSEQIRITEKSGFKVSDLDGFFRLDNRQIQADGFELITPHSRIRLDASLDYQSLQDLFSAPEESKFILDAPLVHIGYNDINYFSALLPPEVNNYLKPGYKFDMRGSVNGTLAALNIPYLKIEGLAGTEILVRGQVFNATDPEKLRMELSVDPFKTTRPDLAVVLPEGTLPPGITLPEEIAMKGSFAGTLKDLKIRGFQATLGNDTRLIVSGRLRHLLDTTRLAYDLSIDRFETTRPDLLEVMDPEQLLPEGFGLPAWVRVNGSLKGNLTDISFRQLLPGDGR